MSLGPLMIDIVGTEMTDDEKTLLLQPEVGGVILFTRNFESVSQICQLIDDIHALRTPHLLVAVDHEGGRVQRFRDGFTILPPAAKFEKIFQQDNQKGRTLARTAGWLMAAELRAIGVDFSFAPVLDLAHGVSGVIGDRAFARRPQTVATLAFAFMRGMLDAGMSAVGKHFPGHGAVVEDSHIAMPVDHRELDIIMQHDVIPFKRMIENGIAGIMSAHVVYDQVDKRPAGYSQYWLQTILRGELNFPGAIFSDDLSMEAAGIAGGYGERAEAALAAGCDMALVCNHTEGAAEAVDFIRGYMNPASQMRLMRMHGKQALTMEALMDTDQWQQAVSSVTALVDGTELELDV